jgi:hypothetical protein
MATRNMVIGIFNERAAATEAIKSLRESGIEDEQIGFVVRKPGEQRADAGSVVRGVVGGILGGVDMLILPFVGPADAINMLEGTLPAAEDAIDHLLAFVTQRERHQEQAAPTALNAQEAEQAAIPTDGGEEADSSGIAAGGLAGGIVGAVGSALFIPGIGPAIAGGVLGMAIVGAAVGGITGGFLGALMRMGVPEDKARYYEQEFKAGNIIMTIKPASDEQEQQVHRILQHWGARDVGTHATAESAQ